jgi:hypothetical protein
VVVRSRLLVVQALRQRRDPSQALELARAAFRSNFGSPRTSDHLIHALAFDAQGRTGLASRPVRVEASRIERDGMFPTAAGILFPLAPIYRWIAEMAEADGDTGYALEYYGAFASLWADADPVAPGRAANLRVWQPSCIYGSPAPWARITCGPLCGSTRWRETGSWNSTR